ncbi:MAG: head-tail connector protein [Hyphomicrobiales bacterium]|nr:head-tail connector protein [Hyphomicrobiales bacterium]
MTPVLLVPPAVEPVALADAKSWLKVDSTDDDGLITGLITSARMIIEQATRRRLITQGWRLIADAWPQSGLVAVPLAPFAALDAITVFDAGNNPQALAVTLPFIDATPDAARLSFTAAPLAPGPAIAGIYIDVSVGYGATGAAVPQPLLQAILMLIAHWYENRGDVLADSGAVRLPASVAALVAPFRAVRLT